MEGQALNASFGSGRPVQPASQEEIRQTPLWHLFNYDLSAQTLTLMRIEERLYREASFLDHRIGSYNCPSVAYELRHMAEIFPRLGEQRGQMGFIFHIGHCGSTLLSRAMSAGERVLPLREPQTLRNLSADQRELDTPLSFLGASDWNWLLSTVIDTLARRFRGDQFNIVKATSTGNNLIAPILEEDPRHKALLLYVPLESYLATMLGKKARGGDLWGQGKTRMQDWLKLETGAQFALHELDEPRLAVLSWMTSMHYMLSARASYPDRTQLVSFEDLIEAPDTGLPQAAEFFGLADQSETIVARFPEISSSYSKLPGQPFTPQTREDRLNRTRTSHPEQIRAGLEWFESLAAVTPALEACREFVD